MSFDRYKKDIDRLLDEGKLLETAIIVRELPEEAKRFEKAVLDKLPEFRRAYQPWYSEALVVLSQLLPDRIDDFRSYYSPLRARKELTNENYTITDYLQGLSVTHLGTGTIQVTPQAAIPKVQQQVNIVSGLKRRFDSSLFDIRALVQADFFDNELDAAAELNKNGFHRGSGALAGVVLEGHLRTTCDQHKITVPNGAMLGKLNELLKQNNTIDLPTWRFIQHLTDLRNLCDHKLTNDPTKIQIDELIAGVRKITKTVF